MKICTKCILPETFPGIKFDDDGICNFCHRDEKAILKSGNKKVKYREKLDSLVRELKGKAPSYDVIAAYSGGKDSSYTLKLLKDRYELRILAFTFDNHFVSPVAWKNIEKITNTLHIDHLSFKPPWRVVKDVFSLASKNDIFPAPTLLRASAICTACIGIVKSIVLKLALELQSPMVAYGWSPGQAPIQSALMKTNAKFIEQNQKALKKAFPQEIRSRLSSYFIPEVYYDLYKDRFPYNVHPLAFFHYDERMIVRELEGLGWQAPRDTDTNSTNCLLNAFANQCHIERHGFHPYVWEIANMVRQGMMEREEGIEKIYAKQDNTLVRYALERLGVETLANVKSEKV